MSLHDTLVYIQDSFIYKRPQKSPWIISAIMLKYLLQRIHTKILDTFFFSKNH